jgi:hypothetical protein
MYKIIPVLLIVCCLSGCVSTTPAGSSGADNYPDPAAAQKPQPSAPPWISDPYSVYDRASFVAAVGHGPSRDAAEWNALTTLTAFFGQSIRSDLQATAAYREAMVNGSIRGSSQTTEITEALRISVEMDTLVGAELRDSWYDQKSVYYALAVMEKTVTEKLYPELIASNLRIIDTATNLSEAEKYSLDGVVSYNLAASAADAAAVFVQVLSAINSDKEFGKIKSGKEYRIEAVEIIKRIPIRIRVQSDRSDRIKGAFAAVLTKMGFRTGGNDSPYELNVQAVFSRLTLESPYKWYRYEISADLIDAKSGAVLLPYGITDRAGHAQLEEAEKRAVADAEEKIMESYGNSLREYLTRLSDKKRP